MSYATNFLCIGDGKILAADASRNMPLVLRDLKGRAEADASTYGRLFKEMKSEYSKMSPRSTFPGKGTARAFGIDFEVINVENLTGGYGGIHCMTSAISRPYIIHSYFSSSAFCLASSFIFSRSFFMWHIMHRPSFAT